MKSAIQSQLNEEAAPLFSRLYLPYCAFSSRAEALKGLRVDAMIWGIVLLIVLVSHL